LNVTSPNREFAAMLADEYILSFISLSAHIQPTGFYQLLLLSSSSVFQLAVAPGWTLKNTSTAASPVRWALLNRRSNFNFVDLKYLPTFDVTNVRHNYDHFIREC